MYNTKSRLLISSIVSIVFLTLIAFSISTTNNNTKKNTKFYLSDKYYNNGEVIKLDEDSIKDVENENFLLFTYNNFCGMAKPCEDIFDSVLKKYKIDYVSIPIESFRKTKYHNTVKIAPSFIIIKSGEIVAYLDAEKDSDLDYYQNEDDFEKWLSNYIYLNK